MGEITRKELNGLKVRGFGGVIKAHIAVIKFHGHQRCTAGDSII
jgi:hypothetical protein